MRTFRPLAFCGLVLVLLSANGALGPAGKLAGPGAAAAAAGGPATNADFTGDTIYQIITDRFYNGDTSNDNPASSPNLNSPDHSNWTLYWGGDWAGITQKMP